MLFKDISLYKNLEIPFLLNYLLPNNQKMPDIYYTPKKEIFFEDGKYLIMKTDNQFMKNVERIIRYIFPGTIIGATAIGFCLIISTKFNMSAPIITYIFLGILIKNIQKLLKTLIKEIYLLSDGKHIKINTYLGSITYDIKEVRKFTKKELILHYYSNILKSKSIYPMVLGQRIFHLIPEYYDVELLPVIFNSSYIKVPKYDKKTIIYYNV